MNKLFETEEKQEKESIITKNGYPTDEVISAIQKEIRRGNEYKACFWAVELMESDLDFRMWRRLKVIAAEDVSNPLAVSMTAQNEWAFYKIGKTSDFGKLIAIKAVINLCREPKDRTADELFSYILDKRKEGDMLDIPEYAKDMHTRSGRLKKRGLSYFYWEGTKLENESPTYEKKYLEYFRNKYPKK